MSTAHGNVIEIKPKIKYLSPTELIAQRNIAVDESPRNSLKRTSNENSAIEEEELRNAHAYLRDQLSGRLIERQSKRSVAKWREDKQAAEVIYKDGKFECFGYSQEGKLYLEYYEALFLLEVNRLQLEYCEMIVSIEQAYVLMLGEESSEKYNKYLVYSALSRAGYIVFKHQMACTPPSDMVTKEDCIWAVLDAALTNTPIPTSIKVSKFYSATQKRMTELKQQIKSQTTISTESDTPTAFTFHTRKRRAQSEPHEEQVSKRAHTSGRSLIENLKDEPSYEKFRDAFNKLDVVQLHSSDYNCDGYDNLSRLKISFDLHLHNEGFRRSAPKTPNFSAIILSFDEPFPTHAEIVSCQRQQQTASSAPLLIISVGESKQIHAFLYYIS